jgi:hypothetical protein
MASVYRNCVANGTRRRLEVYARRDNARRSTTDLHRMYGAGRTVLRDRDPSCPRRPASEGRRRQLGAGGQSHLSHEDVRARLVQDQHQSTGGAVFSLCVIALKQQRAVATRAYAGSRADAQPPSPSASSHSARSSMASPMPPSIAGRRLRASASGSPSRSGD